jgi:hypothetical protein
VSGAAPDTAASASSGAAKEAMRIWVLLGEALRLP